VGGVVEEGRKRRRGGGGGEEQRRRCRRDGGGTREIRWWWWEAREKINHNRGGRGRGGEVEVSKKYAARTLKDFSYFLGLVCGMWYVLLLLLLLLLLHLLASCMMLPVVDSARTELTQLSKDIPLTGKFPKPAVPTLLRLVLVLRLVLPSLIKLSNYPPGLSTA
jgi:hypothetical protein